MASLHVWLQFKVPLHMMGLRFCEDPPAGSLITPYVRGLLGAGWVGGLVVWGLLTEQALVLCACRPAVDDQYSGGWTNGVLLHVHVSPL